MKLGVEGGGVTLHTGGHPPAVQTSCPARAVMTELPAHLSSSGCGTCRQEVLIRWGGLQDRHLIYGRIEGGKKTTKETEEINKLVSNVRNLSRTLALLNDLQLEIKCQEQQQLSG